MFQNASKNIDELLNCSILEPEETVAQRIAIARRELKFSQAELAEGSGIARASISKIENGKQDVPIEIVLFLNRAHGISLGWLLTGKGGMIQSEESTVKAVGLNDDFIERPFVPIRAYATFAENCGDAVKGHHLEMDTIKIRRVEGVNYEDTIVLEIEGNSMGGKYSHGTQVLARPVSDGNWQFASGVYAVSVGSMFLIKRIKENRLSTEGRLTLYSDNPSYGDMEVLMKQINCMWKIGEVVFSPAE